MVLIELHPPATMWCRYEQRTVPYAPAEHLQECSHCQSRTHAACVCPTRRKKRGTS